MEKVKITEINWRDGEKNGTAWHKCGIKTNVHGDKWLGCFESKTNSKRLRALAVGQEIEVVVEKSGDYFNFRLPDRLDKLDARVTIVENWMKQQAGTSSTSAPASSDSTVVPEEGPEGDDW